jgi:coenzyme F420-0:L-glutamate ligase/coenzyme F420-1:gamma-L-glutamate ligase
MDAYDAITGRRSLRQFASRSIARPLLHKLLYAACLAPAPHHTRPWRFVTLETDESRSRLANAMGAAWRRDLEADGVEGPKIAALLARSRKQIAEAPALVLGCLVSDGLRRWPDERRQRAEWGMVVQSMGCALENLMVAAHNEGLASFWISAPSFCPDAVREALDLPSGYEAQALVVLGYPAEGVSPGRRPELDLATLVASR